MRRNTRLSLSAPSAFAEPTLREMWRFRLRFMRLRPGVDPELDFARFSAVVRAADLALLVRDGSAALRGMIVLRAEVRTPEGRRFLWIFPEYGFLDPSHRGGAWFHFNALAVLHRLRRPHGDLPAYVISAGWPSGFLSYRLMADVRILGDPRASDWERRMVSRIAEEIGGGDWEPDRLRIRMRVLPDFPFRSPTSPRMKKSYEYYLAHNPEWREGYTAVVYYRVLPESLDWARAVGGILLERVGSRLRKASRRGGTV